MAEVLVFHLNIVTVSSNVCFGGSRIVYYTGNLIVECNRPVVSFRQSGLARRLLQNHPLICIVNEELTT